MNRQRITESPRIARRVDTHRHTPPTAGGPEWAITRFLVEQVDEAGSVRIACLLVLGVALIAMLSWAVR